MSDHQTFGRHVGPAERVRAAHTLLPLPGDVAAALTARAATAASSALAPDTRRGLLCRIEQAKRLEAQTKRIAPPGFEFSDAAP